MHGTATMKYLEMVVNSVRGTGERGDKFLPFSAFPAS